jgi:putative heme-binding domain-containing protein
MIWWGFEEHANDHATILNHFNKPENWNKGTKANGVSPQENLMRRWALSGQQKDLIACASLLELAPNKEQTSFLMKGFEKAFEGSSLPPFPEKLVLALAKARGNGDLILKIRRQDKAATTMAIEELKGQKASLALRIQITRALGDVGENKAIPILLQIARKGKPLPLRQEALLSLQKFPDPEIAKAIIRDFGTFPKELQQGALHLLASRKSWALTLVEAFASGDIAKEAIDSETLSRMRLHKSSSLKDKMNKTFGSVPIRSETDLDKELARYQSIASSGGGNPKMGESLYFGKAGCSSCHTLFDKGGRIGPDLTSYDRSNLDAFLLAIVRPNAEIREGFEHNLLTTKDGRILSGFKVEENPRIVILRGLDGQDHVVPRDQIANWTPMARSLMPEGLLSSLQEGELRHLFAYLASTTPPK